MKGLKEYIKKHGKHFTEELAYQVAGKRWNAEQIERAAQKKVYYNVTGSTLGDMVFLTNEVYDEWNRFGYSGFCKCILYTLHIVGDYTYNSGLLFDEWVNEMKRVKLDIDLRPYI